MDAQNIDGILLMSTESWHPEIKVNSRTNFYILIQKFRVRDSAVGIATRYGLDGPGIESRWGGDFPHPPRPALGPTQPPVQWVPGLSRG